MKDKKVILISLIVIVVGFLVVAWLNTPVEVIHDSDAPPLEYSFGGGEIQE